MSSVLGTQNLYAFVIAGIILNLIPGPDTLFILGRSMTLGRRAGVLSVLGISSGILCHVVAAAFGLSALLAASIWAFAAIKTIGAAYLIFLGIQTLLDRSPSMTSHSTGSVTLEGWKIYRQALVTNLLNPKVALFMVAFLPQFVRPQANLGAISFLFLGSIFVTTSTLWGLVTAFCSASATLFLRKNQKFERILKRITGSLFVLLGINLLRAKA